MGSPYILMSKVDGMPLLSVWTEMGDEKHKVVLRQVIDIILDLASHHFDKIGVLFRQDSVGKDAWCIKPILCITHPDDPPTVCLTLRKIYTSATNLWLTYANAKLKSIMEDEFGCCGKEFDYAQAWFLRSIIPTLFDPLLDAKGFPITPNDFHS